MGRVTLASLGPLGKELGSGGQGTVYALPRSQAPLLVYKAYSNDVLADLDVGVLTDMIELPSGLPERDRHKLLAAAAWPLDSVVDDSGSVRGFTMAQVPERFHTTLKLLKTHQTRLGQTQLLLNPPDYLDRVELRIDDRFRFELLADIAATLRLFHRLGLTVGDLSPNNLLYSRTGTPCCHFIDCDAMQLDGRTVLPQVETTDWEVPAGGGALGSEAGDAYKFALLCIRLFAGDQSTMDPEVLLRVAPEVFALAQRVLSGDADNRPSLGTWERMLRAAKPTSEPPAMTIPSPRISEPTPRRIGATVPAPATAARPVRRRLTRARRRSLVKVAVAALILGFVGTHTAQIESVARQAVQATEAAVAGDHAEAQAQADKIAAILTSSAPVRDKVKGAVTDLAACKNLTKSVSDLGAASTARRSSLAAASALVVTELDDGAVLKSRLVSAFQHSKAADDAYRRWGQKLSKLGCRKSVRNGQDRQRGDKESTASTKAKQDFAKLWNEIGPDFGHKTVAYQNI
ncbi:hypothetical protein ACIA5C_31740 [Actinoplanes sp. NPDC051343]|uniref:hypothetical protein n=1 Tax=Actinoplanes sp. NPDC051343 TaxID=3363906 RepID=UPI00379A808F